MSAVVVPLDATAVPVVQAGAAGLPRVDPALLVALPLLASVLPAAAAFVRERLGWPLALATLAAQTVLALAVAANALDGPVVVDVGGIPAPYGVRLVVDGLSAPFVVLVAVAGLAVLAYTRRAGPRSAPFYSLYLLLVAGLTGVCVTADVFNLYVFLEISGLASYALVARAPGGRAALAALKYLLAGTVGASLYLLGVGYAYVATGTLSMAAFAARTGADRTLVLAAFGLMAVGLGVKMALYPLHVWKPDAYEAAPTGVTALLAALVSTVAAYALARLVVSAFGVDLLAAVPAARTLLLAGAGVSIAAGSLLAYRSRAIKRLLAYSSVSQFGIVLVGVALATPAGLAGAVIHLVGHAVTKAGLFLATGVVSAATGAETVEEYAGLAREAPATAAAVAVMALGLVGIPPTVGFAGKLYVALAALEAGAATAFALVALSTLFSLAYFAPLLQRMYVEPAPGGDEGHREEHADADGHEPDGTGGRVDAPAREPFDAARVSAGMLGPVLAAAAATLVLGLSAATVEGLLAPTLEGLL